MEFIPVGAYIQTEHNWGTMVRCGGLLPLLISFVIALNIKQTDSSKQDHQLKKLIEDNKERLIEVFSELFSEGEGEGKLIFLGGLTLLPIITKFYEKCIQGNKVRNGSKTIRTT